MGRGSRRNEARRLILVDSSVWIAYLRGESGTQSETLERLLGNEPILVGDLILTEVLQGIRHEREFRETRNMLAAFEFVELGGREIAIQAARNHRTLRAAGITVRKTIDSIIATWCIENGCRLLHHDRDFEPFVKHLGLHTV